jgi:phosphatidylglycerophosphatase A
LPPSTRPWSWKGVEFLASFGYLGKIPKGPGTWGTLGAIPLVGVLQFLPPTGYMIFCALSIIVAIFVAQNYESSTGSHDASEIVIDEVVGYMVAMLWLPWTWQAVVLGFVLFRILDIWKPLFIGYLDRRLKGGLGVVMDDVAAGMVTNVILQILYVKTSWLGEKWML